MGDSPRRRLRSWRWRLRGLAILGGVALGAARASGEQVSVRYQAPVECPGRGDFLGELRARTARADVTETRGQERLFDVVITRGEEGFRGRVQVRGGTGASTERGFADERCSEVASALALVVALAIDPEASTAPLATASGAPAVLASAAPVASALTPSVAASTAPVASPAPVPVASAPRGPAEARERGWRPAVSLTGAGIIGPGPRPLVGGAVAGEMASTSPRALSLAVRLGLVATVVAPTRQASDRAAARLLGARLDVCPLRLRADRVGQLDLCAATQAGALRGEGLNVASPVGSWRSWVAAGAVARARHTTRAGFFVEAELGLLAPLTHDPLVLTAPAETVYTPPRVVVPVALGVGVDFL